MANLRVPIKDSRDRSYDIVFSRDLKSVAADLCQKYSGRQLFIITDDSVGRLYAPAFVKFIKSSGEYVSIIRVPVGEASKSRKVRDNVEDRLFALNAERSCVIVALGGGVVGDLAGFVAATYHRGVSYVQVPTTLLAQVDSSIGGKIAINHTSGKNLLGSFYQPEQVYILPKFLTTLPEREFRNGMAEVIKYAAILDKRLFTSLERNVRKILLRDRTTLLPIIRRCCELKKEIVVKDERESDLRRVLNYGHTIGHAVETLSHYRTAHGEAVAIGMIAEGQIAVALALLSQHDLIRLRQVVKSYGLPSEIPARMPLNRIFDETIHDKKANKGIVYFTLLKTIGTSIVGYPLKPKAALKAFKKGATR
ncbi:MAG TPA: 3-dehydroquinate synthase [Bacteroidota bacterium]|nr:3-dehydroquinate synthase [Bacteroidota bacterium]